ncbi:hypothetical protein D3C81_1847650 [compost metagenome]
MLATAASVCAAYCVASAASIPARICSAIGLSVAGVAVGFWTAPKYGRASTITSGPIFCGAAIAICSASTPPRLWPITAG